MPLGMTQEAFDIWADGWDRILTEEYEGSQTVANEADHEILVAVGLGHGCILGYEGRNVFPFITDGDYRDPSPSWMDADNVFPAKGYPAEPGIYLWRGSIEMDWPEDQEYAGSCEGVFTPATPEDMARLMGKHDRLTVADDGPDDTDKFGY